MKPDMLKLLVWYDRKTNKKFDHVDLADELSCCLCVPPTLKMAHSKFKRKSHNDRRSIALTYLGLLFERDGT
jgi:hypothetical protein